MPFDERRFEVFAVAIEAETIVPVRKHTVDVDQVADALGFPREEAYEYVAYLQEMGWANRVPTDANNYVVLTISGRRKIREEYGRPRWQRWIHKHSVLVNFLLTTLAVLAAIISAVAAFRK